MCHDEAKKHVWEQMVIKFSVNAAGSSLARARARSPRICLGRLDYARRRRAVKTLSRLARTTRVRSEQPATAEQQRPAAAAARSRLLFSLPRPSVSACLGVHLSCPHRLLCSVHSSPTTTNPSPPPFIFPSSSVFIPLLLEKNGFFSVLSFPLRPVSQIVHACVRVYLRV